MTINDQRPTPAGQRIGQETPPRRIITHSRGVGGPINRLASPSDLGEVMKPFVFLDHFDLDGSRGPSLENGWHPHSGIATVTVVFEGTARYAETTGNDGTIPAGGVEWMRAGGGVWHTGGALPGRLRGFQLWVALPEHLEHAADTSHYVMPDEVPEAGPARVILGSHEGLHSPIDSPPMTYLAVTLAHRERWTYQPPAGHDIAWLAVSTGAIGAPTRISRGEVAVFEQGQGRVDITAQGDTQFVLGSAPHHPHRLVLGSYSVHTSPAALHTGETEIRRIGTELRNRGKRSYALARL